MDVVMYVPPGLDAMRWRRECRDYCLRHGYRVVAVAHDARSVEALWAKGRIARVVVARPEHVRTLAYATEVVTEDDRRLPRQQRRTHRRQTPGPAGR